MATIIERATKAGKKRYTVQIRLKDAKPIIKTFQTKGEANAFIQDRESDIRHGRHFPKQEAQRRTLAELIDRFLDSVEFSNKARSTQELHRQQLAYWRTTLGHKTLAGLTAAIIAEERDRLLEGSTQRKAGGKLQAKVRCKGAKASKDVPNEKRTPATCNRYMTALSHCLSCGKKMGWLENNPCADVEKVKEPRGRVRVLTQEERAALMDACRASKNESLYDAVVLMLSTAARKNEIMHLRWPDVEFEKRQIVIQETKNGSRRVLPIRGEAESRLAARAKFRRLDTDLVFPGRHHPGLETKPLSIRATWDLALDTAGITNFRIHDLRHCAASAFAANGATLAELAALLGHRQLSMVQRYAHFCEGHGGDLVERMNAKLFGGADDAKNAG